jgi:DNA-binding YbaB/EbfC family protein
VFKGLGNFAEMIKQAARMQGELKRISEELKGLVVEGSAAGGMVKVRVNGKQEVIDCKIDPQVFADRDAEFLEDLIVAAMNQALEKARQAMNEQMSKAAGGMNIPGLTEAIGSFETKDGA